MKRAIFEGAYSFTVEDVPEPKVGPGQVLVKMRYCSVCGSDVHLYKHDRAPNDSLLAEGFLKVMGMSVHDTIGHQISGDVVALGEGVTFCRVGDRVALQCPGGGYGEWELNNRWSYVAQI